MAGLLTDIRTVHGWEWTTKQGEARHEVIIRRRGAFGNGIPLQESQGYELRVEADSIVIAAPTAAGRYYGVQTLRQLVRSSPAGVLTRMAIEDHPDLEWRGISDDISRGQASTLEDFKETLEHLGYYKANLYCLYLEDMARFWSAPDVGADRGALTPSELRLIVEEARRHHITVMPVFQTLGHQERLLANPAFRQYAELQRAEGAAAWLQRTVWSLLPAIARTLRLDDPREQGPVPTCFSPVLPAARERVKELVDEIAASTPSPFFHLGGDEPADLGKGKSKRAVDRVGLGAVYGQYMSSLAEHVRVALKRRPVVFGDVFLREPAAMAAMPKDIAIMDWQYDPSGSAGSLQRFRDAGFSTVLASPGLWNWFAIYPDFGRAFPNISRLAVAAKQSRSDGLVAASWGDGGAESLRRSNWPGYAYAAELGWAQGTDVGDFFDRFVVAEYGASSAELGRAHQLTGWQTFPTLGRNQRLFHMKPRVRIHSPSWITRMAALEGDMAEVRRLVDEASNRVRFNQASLAALDHGAARFQYAARRELTLEQLARNSTAPVRLTSVGESRTDLASLEALRDSSTRLTERYSELWLLDNRRPMLRPLLDRMALQTHTLDSLAAAAMAGRLKPEQPGRSSSVRQ